MYICLATFGFTVEDIAPVNTENIEGLALSQEGKPQTHSGKIHVCT